MPSISYFTKISGVDQVIRQIDRIGDAWKRAGQAAQGGMGSARVGGQQRPGMGRAPRVLGGGPEVEAAKRQAREQERLQRYLASVRDRSLANEQKAFEKTEQQKRREANKTAAYLAGVRNRSMLLEQRAAEQIAHKREQTARRRLELATGIGTAAVGGGAMAIGAAGIAAGGAAYAKRAAERDKAIALSIAGRGAGQEAVSPEELMRDATNVARQVKGTRVGDLLEAQQRYVAMTGDLEGARRHGKSFARVARASGATEESIAATAATMRDKFGIEDPDEMRKALANLHFQGKAGAFELSDASRYFTEMGAAGQRFGLGKGARGVQMLGGLAQLARMSTGTGAEASTAMQGTLRMLTQKADLIKKQTKTDVFTDKGKTQTRDVRDVITEMIGGAKGNLGTLQGILTEEGVKGVSVLISKYNEAAEAMGAGATEAEKRAAGEKAVRKMMDDTIDAGGDWSDMMKDAEAATNTASATMTQVWEEAAAAMGDPLIKPIQDLAEALGTLDFKELGENVAFAVEALAGMVKFLADKFDIKLGKDRPSGMGVDDQGRSTTPHADLASNRAEQAALTKGPKTKAAARKLRELKSQESELQEQLADPSNPWVAQQFIENAPVGPLRPDLLEEARARNANPTTGQYRTVDATEVDPMKLAQAKELGARGPERARDLASDPFAGFVDLLGPASEEDHRRNTAGVSVGGGGALGALMSALAQKGGGGEEAGRFDNMEQAAMKLSAAADKLAAAAPAGYPSVLANQ